jgi:hypothetical protein
MRGARAMGSSMDDALLAAVGVVVARAVEEDSALGNLVL